ncbi:MAG: hypothetical protein HFH49_17955 [Lachnospiraceae bacterium]|nr:hypothetical protein [Lachnospiraceae bacterium]
MTKKKNGFLALCFSLVPGAGEMYMGFMKQGVSIMSVFWVLIFLAAFLDIGPVLFILPILWCYSFFNVHNIRGMSDEEFYALEDDYLFHLDRVLPMEKWSQKQNTILALILIIVGASMLWNYLMDYLNWLLPNDTYWHIMNDVPQVCVSLLLILGGLYLIRGKKRELDEKEEKREELMK